MDRQTSLDQLFPDDWTRVRLGDIADIRTGDRDNQDKCAHGKYPFFVRSPRIERIDSHSYDGEAILVPGEGDIGEIFHYINGKFDFHQRVYKISDFPPDVDGRFLYHYLRRFFGRHALRHSVKATVDSLRLPTFQTFDVYLPERSEQQHIASVLDDCSSLVESLDELIVKKRSTLSGVIHALVNCQRRLPGHQEHWRSRTIDSMCSIVSGGTPNSQEPRYWNGDIPWCTPTDVTSTRGPYLTSTERTLTPDGVKASSATVLPAKALLLCTRATIGAVKIAGRPMATNQGFKALICEDVDPVFLYYKLLTMKPMLERLGAGSTFLEVSKSDLASIEVKVPSLAEQEAIAKVLADMDAEIDALVAQRNKTAQLKQAMMQELLTGRTRLS